jgi:hypothetical protein
MVKLQEDIRYNHESNTRYKSNRNEKKWRRIFQRVQVYRQKEIGQATQFEKNIL